MLLKRKMSQLSPPKLKNGTAEKPMVVKAASERQIDIMA